jgi:hypothetical protein
MCGAIIHAKRQASPIPASIAIALKPSKLSRKTAAAKRKPPPQDPPPPTHPSGVIIDIVGTRRGNHGHSCEEHPDACGMAVLADDVIISIRKEQILVDGGGLQDGER